MVTLSLLYNLQLQQCKTSIKKLQLCITETLFIRFADKTPIKMCEEE